MSPAEMRPIIVVVTRAEPSLVAHEFAHSFLHIPSKRLEVLSSEHVKQYAKLEEIAGAWKLTDRLEKPKKQREREAMRLQAFWGFPETRPRRDVFIGR